MAIDGFRACHGLRVRFDANGGDDVSSHLSPISDDDRRGSSLVPGKWGGAGVWPRPVHAVSADLVRW